MNKKSPALAFILNFFIVGLGLAYLKKWKKALINVLAAFFVGYMLNIFMVGVIILLFIAILSGAWAYFEAEEMNRKYAAEQELEREENAR